MIADPARLRRILDEARHVAATGDLERMRNFTVAWQWNAYAVLAPNEPDMYRDRINAGLSVCESTVDLIPLLESAIQKATS